MKSFTLNRQPKVVGWNVAEFIALAAFLIWSAAGLTFTIGHISPAIIATWAIPVPLRQFANLCLDYGDPILIVLAFTNTHLHAARQWTSGVARRWAVIVILCAFVIETFGTITGLPFGEYHYTDGFGPMLGFVPLTIPLAWHVVVTNALFLVRAGAPHVSRWIEAALVGLICTLYDFILEPFATTVKHYWTWTSGAIPHINYISWFALSALLVLLFAPTLSTRHPRDWRPALILGLTVSIFLAGEGT
jgi:uncharacterized membrane protein